MGNKYQDVVEESAIVKAKEVYLTKQNVTPLENAPYSPDLSSPDLFQRLKIFLKNSD
jgi:hypothetical protein